MDVFIYNCSSLSIINSWGLQKKLEFAKQLPVVHAASNVWPPLSAPSTCTVKLNHTVVIPMVRQRCILYLRVSTCLQPHLSIQSPVPPPCYSKQTAEDKQVMGLPHPVWVQSHIGSLSCRTARWDVSGEHHWMLEPLNLHKLIVRRCLDLCRKEKRKDNEKKCPQKRVCRSVRACWHVCTNLHAYSMHSSVMTWLFFVPTSTLWICTFEIKEARGSLVAFSASSLILHINYYSPFSIYRTQVVTVNFSVSSAALRTLENYLCSTIRSL